MVNPKYVDWAKGELPLVMWFCREWNDGTARRFRACENRFGDRPLTVYPFRMSQWIGSFRSIQMSNRYESGMAEYLAGKKSEPFSLIDPCGKDIHTSGRVTVREVSSANYISRQRDW
jgi:hypothetical protein